MYEQKLASAGRAAQEFLSNKNSGSLGPMPEPKRRPGRPSTGQDPDPVRGIRVPDARWNQFDAATKATGTDKSKAANALFAWFNREPGAKLPKRPDAPTEGTP